ncbi:MAG: hypothetical protein ACFFCD_12275 [Promethearchaeota archaeon]
MKPMIIVNEKEHTGRIMTEEGVTAKNISLIDKIQKRIITG